MNSVRTIEFSLDMWVEQIFKIKISIVCDVMPYSLMLYKVSENSLPPFIFRPTLLHYR
jgi:hypothetical protein